MEKYYWPALRSLLSLLATQDSFLKDGITNGGWGPRTTIINEENLPKMCTQAI